MLKDPMPTGANIVLENISLDGLIFKITRQMCEQSANIQVVGAVY